MGKVITDEEREKRMAEDMWLNYFNRYLFESGTISEKEYKRMTEKIAARKANAIRKRMQGERVHLGVLKALQYINVCQRYYLTNFDFCIAI